MKQVKKPDSQVIENLKAVSQSGLSTKHGCSKRRSRIEVIAQNGNEGTHYDLEKKMIKVDVYVEGGIVQDVKSDHDIDLRIFDYDIDGVDEEAIDIDNDGNQCVINEWNVSPKK